MAISNSLLTFAYLPIVKYDMEALGGLVNIFDNHDRILGVGEDEDAAGSIGKASALRYCAESDSKGKYSGDGTPRNGVHAKKSSMLEGGVKRRIICEETHLHPSRSNPKHIAIVGIEGQEEK